MVGSSLLHVILRDERLTRGLGDAEARILVEWLVEQAERLCMQESLAIAREEVRQLCRRARGIARFVLLWCMEHQCGAAGQLAVTERFEWPLPERSIEPCELMIYIVTWEEKMRRYRKAWQAG